MRFFSHAVKPMYRFLIHLDFLEDDKYKTKLPDPIGLLPSYLMLFIYCAQR